MAATTATSTAATTDVVPASPSSIPLYLINGVATVWDAQVAATLHCVHNISGLRAGTLPGVASQNAFLGLPITLMQEETAYLVRQGIAHLVPVNREPAKALPSPEDTEAYNAARIARIRAQEARFDAVEAEKNRLAKAKFAQAGDAAREKREARARARAEKERARKIAEGLLDEDVEAPLPPTVATTSPNDSAPPAPAPAPVPAPAPPSGPIREVHFHTVRPDPLFPALAYGLPIRTLPHPLFPFPSTPRDRALLDTVTTLISRGLRVGLGPRFGGEYLVYPGDYLRYHAHFTSQVLVQDEYIRPSEIVAWGRLGTGTKKAGLLCCWEAPKEDGDVGGEGDKVGEVEFYSLEWASFG